MYTSHPEIKRRTVKELQGGFTAIELSVVIILLLGIAGWVSNIVQLAHMSFDHITGLLVLKVVGIFMVPLGSILGILGWF